MLTNVIIDGICENSHLEQIRELTTKFNFLEWSVQFSLDDNGNILPSLQWTEMLLRFLGNDSEKLIATIDEKVACKFIAGEMTFLEQFGTIRLNFKNDEVSRKLLHYIIEKAERKSLQILSTYSQEIHEIIMHEITDIHDYRVILDDDLFNAANHFCEAMIVGTNSKMSEKSICDQLELLHATGKDFFIVIAHEESFNNMDCLHKIVSFCLEKKNRIVKYA